MVATALNRVMESEAYTSLVEDPTDSSMFLLNALDVQYFDNTEFEEREPQDWIRLGQKADGSVQIPVVALFDKKDHGFLGTWKSGFVTAYDSKTELFTVAFNQSVKKLCRLELCFKAEDPEKFVRRVQFAHCARIYCQSVLRRNLYVDSMPVEDLSELGTEASLKIAALAVIPFKRNGTELPDTTSALKEIQIDYHRTMSQIVFERAIMESETLAQVHGIAIPEFECLAMPIRKTEIDLELPPSGYADQFIGFSFQTYLTCPEALHAMLRVNEECLHIADQQLLSTKSNRSLKLEEYRHLQATYQRGVLKIVTEEWPTKVASAIKSTLSNVGKGWYNLNETRRDTYEFSKLRTLLRRMNVIMQDTLRFLTQQSLQSYESFIEKATEGMAEIDGFKHVLVSYPDMDRETIGNERWYNACVQRLRQRPPPLFAVSIKVSTDKYVINKDEIQSTAGKIAKWKPSDPEDPTDVCPYTPVEPIYGHVFVCSTEIRSFADGVIETLDKTLDELKNIKQIEQIVMHKLFWSCHPCINYVSPEEEWVKAIRSNIRQRMSRGEDDLRAYVALFDDFIDILNLDEDQYLEQFSQEKQPNLRHLLDTILNHMKQADEIEEIIPLTPVLLGTFSVNCASIRSLLAEKHRRVASRLKEWHLSNCTSLATELLQDFETINRQLQKVPSDIEQLTNMDEYIETVPSLLAPLLEGSKRLSNYRNVLDQLQFQMAKEDFLQIWKVRLCPRTIDRQVEKIKGILVVQKSQFSDEMVDDQAEFAEFLRTLHAEVDGFKQYTDIARVEQVHKYVMNINQKLSKAEEDARVFNSREVLFNRDITDYVQIGKIRRDFEPFALLWKTAHSWLNEHRKWMEGSFLNVNGEELETFVESNWTMISKAAKYFDKAGIKGCGDIANEIKGYISTFRPNVQLVLALRNPGMQERHWTQLNEALNTTFRPDPGMNLEYVLNLGFEKNLETISKIGATAGKEFQIEKALDQMETDWKSIDLQISPYRETGTSVISGVDEIQAILDEQVTMTQAMQFSAFKKAFEDRINTWERTLNTVSEVLDEWIQVQRSWLYLQPIFDSPDINKQLPTEGKKFATVDKNWRQTLQLAASKPNAIKFCNNDKLLDRFQESSKYLDQVQKGLSDYLETKRAAFSRFYFLSNDELLSILSESKDVKLVQPHLKKCFEGIVQVEFQEDLTISHMISAEGEQVAMFEPVDPKNKNVEHWMTEVEAMMRTSVRAVMYDAIQDYGVSSRVKWIQKWPGMCVLNGSQFHWSREMEESMAEYGSKGVEMMMERQLSQLADMIEMVRGKLDKMARITVGALTVIDVHARDVTGRLVDAKVSTKDDFMWCSQLRYYWEDDLFADMVTARRPYGYEYLGNSFRLVITPLTDKCYMTLMAALQMVLGGAPAGPAGTGKTETTKDLAKALAKQCVVFNCSDGLDYIAMGKFFKGLASCGAWACFDEFNRINIEVLSVIGQQITTLQLAIRAGEKRIIFEDSDIAVSDQFGVFITMNPGYAGRSDLPDSLAALFRPVAMMVPDYAMIGEIMFFAYGYEKAKQCGAKMVTTFKLCSEQLSAQCHYDYGMRAVKTVITAAGNLKRQDPDMDEEVLLLRALQDVNLPKFLAHDIPLFEGIISDLFPGKKRPQLDLGALIRVIKLTVQKRNLQPHPVFLTKVVQLYETLCVRHGLMLVGPTGGGKSSNIRVLCETLTILKEQQEEGYAYENILIYQLNPKAITMGQLYGEFDPNTHEWQDGILSTLYRTAASCTKTDRKWVLFDGPVDAIWIENMNTVLDDNKKLCLSSGEIIQMSNQMTMMFEVEDLSVASPATVSRTGMVYMEPKSIGFDPLIDSWLERIPSVIQDDVRVTLQLMFDTYLRPSLTFIRSYTNELLPQISNNLVQSLMRLLDCFFAVFEAKTDDGAIERPDLLELLAQNAQSLFIFCLVWSVGGTTDEKGRLKFDSFLRNEMTAENMDNPIPVEGLVYDYFFDQEKSLWMPWMSTIEAPTIDNNAPFSELVIPTTDSVRNTFLLGHMLENSKHLMMVGPTGTGKTVNITRFLENVNSDKFIPLQMTFSAQTSANQVQDVLDSKMEKRRKGVFGPTAGKKIIVYVDDLNMPKQEEYFAQPPIEVLRQWFDQGGWYDRKQLVFRNIIDIVFVTSMGPPGGGRNPISSRFVRHFNIIGYTEMSDESKAVIFRTILSSFVSQFDESINNQDLVTGLVESSIDIYNIISRELLPTPAKSHYTFNLRDLAKVFQGVLMGSSKKIRNRVEFLRLWCHESQRVFKDRLTNETDHEWFTNLIKDQLYQRFNQFVDATTRDSIWDAVIPTSPVLFGDYTIPGADPKIYEEVKDMGKLVETVEEYLGDHNAESSSPMNLVMFLNAIEHVSRISRVIRQPRGNALLLGLGGSGRQSLTRLATYMAEYECFQVEITKGYGVPEWREDIKKCLLTAGLENKQIVFLFSDVQIVNETMIEDVNNILNSGDVPNLYNPEDTDNIMTTCRHLCVKKKIPATKLNIYAQYVSLVRQNLHVVLCMSPIGQVFRDRLRMFPSLVNCCTIDWFTEWPAEALHSVASNALTMNDLHLGDHLQGIVSTFQLIHQSVAEQSKDFFQKLRRYNYVTPTSYLELLSTFQTVLQSKREEVQTKQSRLQNGVDKIIATKEQVAGMQEQLVALKPQLEKTQTEVEAMMVTITADKKSADETKVVVQQEEQVANQKAAETKAIADDAQRDLDEALPALESAVACLNKLKKSDIDEVKAMKNPPHGVRLTMEAACCVFGIKPVVKADPDKPGQKIKDYWESAQKTLLSNAKKLLEDMMNFDKDNIPDKIVHSITPYIEMEDFLPAAVRKASVACEAICMWVRAMHTYNRVVKLVEPKKKALAEAEAELQVTMATLADAKGRLQDVVDRLAELEANFDGAVQKKDQLISEVKQCEIRLESALKLIALLGGEEERWTTTVAQLSHDFINLAGDVVISAGTISYLGAFTSEYRDECVGLWAEALKKANVPFTPGCTVISALADPVKVRTWQIAGLPSDNLSVQNGIIMARSRRWPLFIDPQGQANRFIKNLGKENAENGIDIVKLTDKGFIKTLENGIRFGKWILLENINQELDAILEPVLLQNKFKQGGQLMMRVGDSTIPYNTSFRFFMTTKLPSPHYPPETCVKVTLLNFTITPSGLEDQALSVVVQEEMPELAEKKNTLVINNAKMKAELVEIENKILYMLANSKGNILDDTELIDTLGKAKVTSEDINEKMKEAEVTEKEIDETREQYRDVAYRASLLFFCVADLAGIDPMYQYSLTWFVDLFIKGIHKADPADQLQDRLQNLKDSVTYGLYCNVCRSLFETHKLLYSFLLTVKIMQGDNRIDASEWRFLLSGTTGKAKLECSNPDPTWIEDHVWTQICTLSTLPSFSTTATSFQNSTKRWKEIFDTSEPHVEVLPDGLATDLDSFQKLCILRCIRPDKMMEGIQCVVSEQLGRPFIEPPAFDLPGSYADSTVTTPLIFILSSGSDPAKDLLGFAESMKMSRKFNSISLGQGQGALASRMIQDAGMNGKWVLLQNCHLAISWMNQLERICEEFDSESLHRDFRLWLTSKPSTSFPTSVLQNGVKMTKEPPKGIRANLRNTYNKLTNASLECTSKPTAFKKLLFGLSFFHAVIIERKKFGPLGWNIPYAFNDTDYDISRAQLEMFLDFYEEIPYEVLRVMTSVVNYGGRVTDDKDMRTIDVILESFFNDSILRDDYAFSKSQTYFSVAVDESDSHAAYMEYIDGLPINPEPEVFGMHDNANITCAIAETYHAFDIILSLQPRVSGGAGQSREEIIGEMAKCIEDRLPSLFDVEKISMQYPVRYDESMNTVLVQEIQRYNALLQVLKSTLPTLQKALKGLVVMSTDLEAMANSIFDQKVPAPWERKAYPSLKALQPWVDELMQRLDFLTNWVTNGLPAVYWLSGFFFPQGFLTGTLQNHARRSDVPIDKLSFEFIMKSESEDQITAPPAEGGCYITGLFIEGARWEKEEHSLADPLPKELFAKLPVMHLLPKIDRELATKDIYRCPVYKILTRTGTLSTTGHSTNFVFWIEIPSKKPTIWRNSLVSETNVQMKFADQDYWIKAGVACFLSLRY